MSNRPILSRPRTRIYNANYNIGENYYRPALDRLDRKYSGRPLSPQRNQPSLAQDILERHERAFADEDLPSVRRRADKHISEPTLFDSRGGRIAAHALEMEKNFDEETSSVVQRMRANKKVSIIEDMDMDSTVGSLTSRRIKERSDKLLDSIGLGDNIPRKALDEDVTIKRRTLRITQDESSDNKDLTKWSAISEKSMADEDSLAKQRARQSKARLNEIEEEMTALAEKQAARERRAARLRQLVAETADENEGAAVQSVRISTRKEKRTVEI